jgi:hypothetical protein
VNFPIPTSHGWPAGVLYGSDGAIWIPYRFIGSGGFMVERGTSRVIQLGGGFGDIEVYAWAYF